MATMGDRTDRVIELRTEAKTHVFRRPPSLIWEGVAVGWREEFPRPPSALRSPHLEGASLPPSSSSFSLGLDSPPGGLDSPSTGNGPASLISVRSDSALNSLDCWDYSVELDCLHGPEDLQLAAELGKTLLERNKELETSLKHHQAIIEDQGQEIEYLTKQTTALKEVNESRLKVYEQLEVNLQEVETANSRLVEEAAQDRARIKSLSSIVENLEQKCEELQAMLLLTEAENQASVHSRHTLQPLPGGHQSSLATASDTEDERLRPDSPLVLLSHSSSSNSSPLPAHPHVVAQPSSGYSSTSRTDSDGFRTDWDRSHSSQEESLELEVVELGTQMEKLREERREEVRLRQRLEEQVKSLARENCYLSSRLEAQPPPPPPPPGPETRLKTVEQEVLQLAEVSGGYLCRRCLGEVDSGPDLSFLITSAWMADNCRDGVTVNTADEHVTADNNQLINSCSWEHDSNRPTESSDRPDSSSIPLEKNPTNERGAAERQPVVTCTVAGQLIPSAVDVENVRIRLAHNKEGRRASSSPDTSSCWEAAARDHVTQGRTTADGAGGQKNQLLVAGDQSEVGELTLEEELQLSGHFETRVRGGEDEESAWREQDTGSEDELLATATVAVPAEGSPAAVTTSCKETQTDLPSMSATASFDMREELLIANQGDRKDQIEKQPFSSDDPIVTQPLLVGSTTNDQIVTQSLLSELSNGHKENGSSQPADYRTIFREMFRVLEAAKQEVESPALFLHHYHQQRQRKQRRQGAQRRAVHESNKDDFPSLAKCQPPEKGPASTNSSNSYAEVLRKGLAKDEK